MSVVCLITRFARLARLATWPPGGQAIAINGHYWSLLAINGPLLTLIIHYLPLLAAGWSDYSQYSELPCVGVRWSNH